MGDETGDDNRFARTTVQNAKFEVEKFDGTNNFGMWQCEVKDVLAQQDLDTALGDKPEGMSDADWQKVNKMACSTIRLCLAKQQKFFVMRDTMAKELWQKLEDKYMTKSAENRLHLKRRLFYFRYKEGTKMIHHLDAFNKLVADLLSLDQGLKFRVSRKFRRSKKWKFRWKFRGNIDRKKLIKLIEILRNTWKF